MSITDPSSTSMFSPEKPATLSESNSTEDPLTRASAQKADVAISAKTTLADRKLEKRLRGQVGRAIIDYNMIEEGDKVMVCLSGGKDSYAMLEILLLLQRAAPVRFDLVAVNLDQKQPGYPEHVLPTYLDALDVEYHIVEKDTYSIVKSKIPEGKTTCGLCSRLRRGTLYGFAEDIGATKIALGHHRDDIVETMFLNMFHGARLKAMPPKLLSDDKRNIIIRPLAYCAEKDLSQYANYKQFPIIPCNLCGSQENLQRQAIKAMLNSWEQVTPGRIDNIFSSLTRVSKSQLADRELYDFINLKIDRSGSRQHPEHDLKSTTSRTDSLIDVVNLNQ